MRTYGQTSCPNCGSINNMYRPLDLLKKMSHFNEVRCFNCGFDYKHTDKFNNVVTEADQVRQSGRD